MRNSEVPSEGKTHSRQTLHANEAESQRVQNLRREYWTTIEEVKLPDLVFIDETGVNLAMTRRRKAS